MKNLNQMINLKEIDASEIKQEIDKQLKEAFENPSSIKLLVDDLLNYSKKTNVFEKYSFTNALLLLNQKKEITELKTYNAWVKEGVNINKGEKALYVLSPIPLCKTHKPLSLCSANCEKKFFKYKKQPLFDATQTDLKQEEIEEIIDKNYKNKVLNPEFNQLIDLLNGVKPFDLKYEISKDGEGGYTDGKRIVLSVTLDPDLKFTTLLHEFGHHYLEHVNDNKGYQGHIRGIKETQAQMFAWISEKVLNLETKKTTEMASNYINDWTKITKEANPIKEFNKVFNAVTKVFFKPTVEQKLDKIIETKEAHLEYLKEKYEELPLSLNNQEIIKKPGRSR